MDVRDELGRTPLLASLINGVADFESLRMLIDAGSDVRAVDSVGNSVLHASFGDVHLEHIRLLIDAGADVNAQNLIGDTPLCTALDKGHSAVAELLLAAGAGPCQLDSGCNVATRLSPHFDSSSETGIALPCDLHDACAELDAMLHPRFKAMIGLGPEAGLISLHHGLGTWMRNYWGLWRSTPLACWFESLGVEHPDHMSSIVLKVYRRHLRGEPWRLDADLDAARTDEMKMLELEAKDDASQ